MKLLHKFTVYLDKEVDKTETVVRDGQSIKETRKVVEPVPHTIALKKPSRSENDSLKLFYGASVKKAIDAGLFTKAVLLAKHIDGAGSLLSKETAKRMAELTQHIESVKNDIIQLGSIEGDTEKEKKQTALLATFVESQREFQAIESSNSAIFSNTSESYANEKANLWLILSQTYVEKDGQYTPYFKGEKYEQKENHLESLEDSEDKLHLKVVPQLAAYWGYYSTGAISTAEDFKKLEAELEKQTEIQKEIDTPAETPIVEAAAESVEKVA